MDEWYYQVFDTEFGPVIFDELVELAKNNRLSRDDSVRFGETGVWRRAGSIGPLMAHFPFEAVEKVVAGRVEAQTDRAAGSHGSEHELSIDDFVISESTKALPPSHSFTQPLAESFPAPATYTNSSTKPALKRNGAGGGTDCDQPVSQDKRWWCLIEGKEYGPVTHSKLIEWAATGRLHRNDHVRLGQQPFKLSGDLPDLFPAVAEKPPELLAAPKETRPINRPLPPESAPPQPALDAPAPIPAAPVPARSEPGITPVHNAPPAASAFSAPPAIPRPIASPARFSRPMPPRRSPGGGIGDLVKSPIVLGIAGMIVLGGLIFGLMQILPFGDSTNIKRVKELEGLITELGKLRKNETVSSGDAKAIAEKMKKSALTITNQLKDTKDRKAKKVLSVASKMEELSKLDLSKPSDDQSKIDSSLSSLKTALSGAKKAFGI